MESRPIEPTPSGAGRFVADALAAAGVRVAFTVPGESFLPLLEALPAAGIRDSMKRQAGSSSTPTPRSSSAMAGKTVWALIAGSRAIRARSVRVGLPSYSPSEPCTMLSCSSGLSVNLA